MNRTLLTLVALLLISAFALSACSTVGGLVEGTGSAIEKGGRAIGKM